VTPCAAILRIGLRLGIVELRQYTLRPGERDVLIDLFARELVAGQEALGMMILGQFRDLNDPDRFVWVRGFPDMAARPGALEAFYTGPVWKEHGKAANATMIDSDDVLLLRPAGPQPPKDFMAPGFVVAGIHYFDEPVDNSFVERFERVLAPELTRTGGTVLGSYVTEQSQNNFPDLPVREGENVFVWFARFPEGLPAELPLDGNVELLELAPALR
jgi:hypothetical protein